MFRKMILVGFMVGVFLLKMGLKSRIDRRRRRGLVRAEFQLDQRDMTEYTRRSNALSARITEFNRRVEAQKLAVEEFNALVSQFNAGR